MSKSAKQRREEYLNGKLGKTYGIWNGMTKRFVFGIREKSPAAAERKFQKLNPIGSYAWRYQTKAIPDGWVNPKNEIWSHYPLKDKRKGAKIDKEV